MFDLVQKLIEERLELWTTTPIAWDDMGYSPTRGISFIRPTISQTEADMISGNADMGLYREHGLVTIQVFTPRDEGSRGNGTMSTNLGNLLRGYNVDKLYVGAPRVVRVGQVEEWYQSNVMVPFYYDNCTSVEA